MLRYLSLDIFCSSLKAYSFSQAPLLKISSLLDTENVCGQISEHISRQIEATVNNCYPKSRIKRKITPFVKLPFQRPTSNVFSGI